LRRVNPREIARLMSIGRVAVGAGLLLAPRLAAPAWAGNRGITAPARLFARAMGARDIALGAGALAALSRGEPVGGWLRVTVLADATDALATWLERGELPPISRGVYLIGGGAAVAGAAIQSSIDQSGN
jgi:hypothetical protein